LRAGLYLGRVHGDSACRVLGACRALLCCPRAGAPPFACAQVRGAALNPRCFSARFHHTASFSRASAAPASYPAADSLAVLLFVIVPVKNADFVGDVDAIRVDGFPTRLAERKRQRERQRRKLAVLFAVAVRYAERHKDAVRLRLLPGCAARVQRPTNQR